jgi:hypothetical protein
MRTTAGIALTRRYELQIVNAFLAERALSGPSARRLRDLGLKDSRVLQGLITAAVIRKAGPERYFLDESLWANRRQPAAWYLWVAVGGALLALGLGALYLNSR